ncbi:hypothetical protein CR983_01205 [Candidatus Saccharibacteria bacterium]|nr:MAG: hypothetical protein CR983_01205 [Candidatus Saccharibacteria bacterium]
MNVFPPGYFDEASSQNAASEPSVEGGLPTSEKIEDYYLARDKYELPKRLGAMASRAAMTAAPMMVGTGLVCETIQHSPVGLSMIAVPAVAAASQYAWRTLRGVGQMPPHEQTAERRRRYKNGLPPDPEI